MGAFFPALYKNLLSKPKFLSYLDYCNIPKLKHSTMTSDIVHYKNAKRTRLARDQDQSALPSHMKMKITQTGLTSGQGEWDPKPRHPPFIQEKRGDITIFHPQDIIFEQLNSSYYKKKSRLLFVKANL
jgi:hypothetical protein